MFFKANKFRDFCEKLVQYFNFNDNDIQWRRPQVTRSETVTEGNKKKAVSHYIRDNKRVLKLHDGFGSHLDDIINAIRNCDNMVFVQHKLQDLTAWMNIEYNPDRNS